MNTADDSWRDLELIQRWMQTTITYPSGIAEGICSPEARQFINIGPEEAESVVNRSHSQTALERLSIYGYAYYARLLECLREEFPVLQHALGEELFDAFAVGYLELYPSRSYTLFHLGHHFPKYLEETRPDRDANERETVNWPDFLIDIATLELAFNEVFDGPGVEGRDRLQPEQLQTFSPEQLLQSRLITVPCLRLLVFQYPVHHYFTGVRRKEDPELPSPATTFLAVTRQDYVVRHFELSPPAYQLLGSLIGGSTVGEAIQTAIETAESDSADLASHLHDWFHDWTAEGFFQSLDLSKDSINHAINNNDSI